MSLDYQSLDYAARRRVAPNIDRPSRLAEHGSVQCDARDAGNREGGLGSGPRARDRVCRGQARDR